MIIIIKISECESLRCIIENACSIPINFKWNRTAGRYTKFPNIYAFVTCYITRKSTNLSKVTDKFTFFHIRFKVKNASKLLVIKA